MENFIFCAVFVGRHKNFLYYFPDKLVFCKPFKLESFPIISSTRAKEFLTGYSLKIEDFKTDTISYANFEVRALITIKIGRNVEKLTKINLQCLKCSYMFPPKSYQN